MKVWSEAADLRRAIDAGGNPRMERKAKLDAPTVADMAKRCLAETSDRKRARSLVEDRSILRQLILPQLGQLRVAAVRRSDIEAFHGR